MNEQEKAVYLLTHPAQLGRRLGYKDLRDDLHGRWILQIVDLSKPDMTLQAHRGSYKTTCLGIAIAIMMIRYRDKNIIFSRKTDRDVFEVIKSVYRILLSDVFKAIYAALTRSTLIVTKCTTTEISTSCYSAPRGAAQLQGIGIGGSITGKHADIIITDDIVNLKDRLSHAERERTKSFYQEMQNIRNPGGRIINTGTPWHREDCFTLMPAPYVYDVYSTGMRTKQQIEQLRRSMAPSLFAANYELRHIASEDALFQSAPRFTDDAGMLRDGIAHIDAAYGGGDSTAFTCGCRIGDTIYLYGRLWHAHVDTVIDAILSDSDRLLCGPIYCQSNADKGYLGREIRAREHDSIMYPERQNKYYKISTFLRKWWENIVFLEGTDPAYISQIMDYTAQAQHDDAPDSAASLVRILDRRGG